MGTPKYQCYGFPNHKWLSTNPILAREANMYFWFVPFLEMTRFWFVGISLELKRTMVDSFRWILRLFEDNRNSRSPIYRPRIYLRIHLIYRICRHTIDDLSRYSRMYRRRYATPFISVYFLLVRCNTTGIYVMIAHERERIPMKQRYPCLFVCTWNVRKTWYFVVFNYSSPYSFLRLM